MPPTGAVMDKSLFQVLLLSRAFSGVLGPHVFICHWRNWTDAQELCRDQYTDFSPVTCQQDTDQLWQASGGQGQKGWLSIHKAHGNNNGSVWRWSGGGVLDVYWNWVHGEPNSWGGHEGAMEVYSDGRWNDLAQDQETPFYCLSLLVVSHTPLAWEAALEHCRRQRSHVLSMPSDTRHLLAHALLRKAHTTQRVWIGLRYLGHLRLWANGDPLRFQGWSRHRQDGGLCPAALEGSCGAMTQEGVWEARDCQEKLHFICD